MGSGSIVDNRRKMLLALEKKILVGFAVAALVLIAIGGFAYLSVREYGNNSRLISHTLQVLEGLQEVQSSLKDVESAGRGFAVTGQEEYLEPYKLAKSAIPQQMQRLRGMTADNPVQQQRLKTLESLTEAKLGITQSIIEARQKQGMEGAALLIRTNEGQRVMDQIRQQVAAMEDEERTLLAERSQMAESHGRRANFVIVLGTLVALGACALASLLAQRGVLERRRAETAMESLRRESESILNAAGEGIYRLDNQGNATYINPAAARMLGYEPEELMGRPLHALMHHSRPDESPYPREECPMHLTAQDGLSRHIEGEVFWKKDGTRTAVEYTSAPIREGPKITGVVVTFRDVGKRIQAEEDLRLSKLQLETTVRQLEKQAHEITLLGEAGELLQSCQTVKEAYEVIVPSIRKLLPKGSGALCITNHSRNLVEAVATWGEDFDIERSFPPEDCWALRLGRLHRAEHAEMDLLCRHIGRSMRGCSLCVPMMAQGETLGMLHLVEPAGAAGETDSASASPLETRQRLAVALAEQIALALANLNLRETLRNQSIRDPLTGLFNRRYLEESLDRELRRSAREEKALGVILIDLDHFKQFNDTFGHEAGDELLRGLGELLSTRTRKEDIACRYGGEEFLLILPNATLDICCQRAELVRKAVRSLHVSHRGQSIGHITLSIGVAVFPQHGGTTQTLLRTADTALYRAKAEGRDRVVVPEDGANLDGTDEPPGPAA
ncbi:MAG: diguanylate cyclase [Acidobacteriia bacterium]|nr:diguanylate cyclase [Terriglobia bacterium]